MSYDFAALEQRFYGSTARATLTPEVLGKIIAGAWKQFHAGDNAFLTYEDLTDRIATHFGDAPAEVVEILQFEQRPEGVKIDETTRLIVGAQNAGFLARANPQNIYTFIKANLLQTYTMVDGYRLDFPAVVDWAEKLASANNR